MKPVHVVMISNRWFSAVTDYCLQLITRLSCVDQRDVFLRRHKESPLIGRIANLNVNLSLIPWRLKGLAHFWKSWHEVTKLLKGLSRQGYTQKVVWVFEGREHTICALHKKLHPKLWKQATLVRCRGQDAIPRAHLFNRWLYRRATDRVVFAANIIRNRLLFTLSQEQALTQHYCADTKKISVPDCPTPVFFAPEAPEIDFSQPTFLVVGRYDPIKGHSWLLESFSALELQPMHEAQHVQLIFVGLSQNINASALAEEGRRLLGLGFSSGTRHYAASKDGRKRLFMYDEFLPEAKIFMNKAHFGVIPSLGSEVICRVAVEFLQAGTPLIVSTAGALEEVTQGSPTKVVEIDNRKSMTEALAESLQQACNSEEMGQLRKKSSDFGTSRYSLSQFARLIDFSER